MVHDPDSPAGRGAAAAVLPTVAPGSGRNGLDKQRILGSAIALIDSEGLRSLTMRRLGDYLGVEAMAIYHHIHGREELLDGIVETVVDELYGDPDVHMNSTDWQEYLHRLAHGVRRIALAHPEVFPLVCTRPPAAPWVRPPLRSLRWMESFLQTLNRCGFADRAAVTAYQMFSSFLLGHLLLEVSGKGVDLGPIEEPDPEQPSPPSALSNYPMLQRLEPILSEDRSLQTFGASLEVLTDHLESLGKR